MKIKLKGNKGGANSLVIILIIVIFIIAGFLVYFIKNPIVKNSEVQNPIELNSNLQSSESEEDIVTVRDVTEKDEDKASKTEKINEEAETTSKEKKNKLEPVKVLGLDTKFYKLNDAAIYTKTLEKNSKTFEYDLDNDGKKNKLVIDFDQNIIKYDNNPEITKAFLGKSERTHTVYVVDIDESDSYLDIVIFSKSDEEHEYHVLKNVNGKLELMTIPKDSFSYGLGVNKIEAYHIYLDGNDKMLYLDEVEENLSPMITTQYYDLTDGIKKIDMDSSNIIDKNFEAKARIYFTTINMYGEHLYTDLKANNEILPAGTKFKILDIVDSSIKRVELEDGRVGFIFPKYGYL